MKVRVMLAMTLMWIGDARAEGGCPPGHYPYVTPQARQCVPMPGGSSAGGSGYVEVYQDRWGAISMDDDAPGTGGYGYAAGMRSKRAAKRAAINECVESGGTRSGCEIKLVYKNQCAVFAWGGGYGITWRDATIEKASASALEDCHRRSPSCKIYYSGCSYPELIN